MQTVHNAIYFYRTHSFEINFIETHTILIGTFKHVDVGKIYLKYGTPIVKLKKLIPKCLKDLQLTKSFDHNSIKSKATVMLVFLLHNQMTTFLEFHATFLHQFHHVAPCNNSIDFVILDNNAKCSTPMSLIIK